MDENMDYISEEDYTEEATPDDMEISEETGAETAPADPGDIEERIDDLLDQIGVEKTYGSMGDYYVAEAGCYAFPGEDVFYHFIEETERSGWTAASNGCYVPVDLLDAYEAYLSSGFPEEEDAEGEETEALPSPVTQEDLSSLEGILNGIYGQDTSFYETATLHMGTADKTLADIQSELFYIRFYLIVVCIFLAMLCGINLADSFWNRMRAG